MKSERHRRVKITLTKEAYEILNKIKKHLTPQYRRTWLSDFVTNELLRNFYFKTKEELELESIRAEVASINKQKKKLNNRLKYLTEISKELREKIKKQDNKNKRDWFNKKCENLVKGDKNEKEKI